MQNFLSKSETREVRAGGARKILEAEEIADKIDEVVAESTVGAITDKAAGRVEETVVESAEENAAVLERLEKNGAFAKFFI